ncbi:2-oxo-4-hydroxy-4-carboxy-5-ureidoimidazoline decarboxylase [Halalkalibacter alkalisediminis]|uniref:2-oxo-4-hydroxy-4-carboxy-5-ureidoimidazoline decarboxylase n=1 Tax=Halalkalibacter alkalisediminis TaxID=935616 RepID=A0ABV6NEP6_9BACI|nr:2-oxo-4-hydroxy-4-carboxy-5-ureidoimidazoline decarboxylase [Halalkalibacter alkalisediminis]
MNLTMKDVNTMSKQEFVDSVGSVFEHSPWVAEHSWELHPFSNLARMYEVMIQKMYEAEDSLKLSLLRAHPDLGTKLEISESSQNEQMNAGLSQLTEEEYKEFSSMNQRYIEKFSFPFIMAVKGQNKTKIKACMEQRVENRYDLEFKTALKEVSKIAKFRLWDKIDEQVKTH